MLIMIYLSQLNMLNNKFELDTFFCVAAMAVPLGNVIIYDAFMNKPPLVQLIPNKF